MKSAHIARILSLMLAMVLVLSAAPSASAFTLERKEAAPAGSVETLPMDSLQAGGTAPTLMADEVDYVMEAEPNNNSTQANVVDLNTIIVGETSAEDMSDYFKFTLPVDSDIAFVSLSSAPNMIFGLFTPEGTNVAICKYYGTEEEFYIDAIVCSLDAGTYYLMVQQTDVDNGPAAYSGPLAYAIELHVHDYTVVETVEPTCTAAGSRTFACGCEEELPMLNHTYEAGTPVAPTCTEYGYTPYTCSACGASTTDDFVDPLGHSLDPDSVIQLPETMEHSQTCTRCEKTVKEACNFERDPESGHYLCSVCGADANTTVYRIYGETRVETSQSIANALKLELGLEKFDTVIVASAMNFPDALTGSYLAAVKNAPILLTYDAIHADTVAYITQNMTYDGTVYILGGESAVSMDFENRLQELGITYKRLAGADRFGTNLAILEEAGGVEDMVICTAYGFADSLSVSASGMPILLVGDSLTEEQLEFLKTSASGQFVIIGGSSVVSEEVETELESLSTASIVRLAGKDRYETSVLVAERFFPDPDFAVLAYARNYPDGLCGGPLAYCMGAPLILTDGNCSWANSYMAYREIEGGFVLGGNVLIEDSVVRSLFDMAENKPIPQM